MSLANETGTVLLLNGASSSGKTSIARALQSKWSSPLLYFGLDDVISMMPFQYTGDGVEAAAGFRVSPAVLSEPFTVGEQGLRLNRLAVAFVASLARDGFDVVLDYVLNESVFEALRLELADVPVLFCGIYCDQQELMSRELERGDRLIGLAMRQMQRVHFCASEYNLTLDSSNTSPKQLADQVLHWLADTEVPKGLSGA